MGLGEGDDQEEDEADMVTVKTPETVVTIGEGEEPDDIVGRVVVAG